MSNIDIPINEIKAMSEWDLEENIYFEIRHSHDVNDRYRDIHKDNLILLINEAYIRYQIKE
jgi:hypothetical protein